MIKLIIVDVDGVLTDGTIALGGSGDEMKQFHVRDGLGLRLAMLSGKTVAIMTAHASEAVSRRAEQLGIEHVYQQVGDKAAAYEALRDTLGVRDEEVCYIGDDLPDLPVMRRVGMAVAVADAADEVRAAASMVTEQAGGRGAVRSVVERILKDEGTWSAAVARLTAAKEART